AGPFPFFEPGSAWRAGSRVPTAPSSNRRRTRRKGKPSAFPAGTPPQGLRPRCKPLVGGNRELVGSISLVTTIHCLLPFQPVFCLVFCYSGAERQRLKLSATLSEEIRVV